MAAQTLRTQMPGTDKSRNETLVAMPGFSEAFSTTLALVAQEFGWPVATVSGPEEASALAHSRRVAAVFVLRDSSGSSWSEALGQLRIISPEARLIPCCGFSDPVDCDQLRDAGAFHSLWLPLKENELRQCLGFIWQATRVPAQTERTPRKSGLSLTYSAA